MTSRERARGALIASILIGLTLSGAMPSAAAQSAPYDPLDLDAAFFVAPGGMLAAAPPPDGRVAIPGTSPATTAPSLTFTTSAPLPFTLDDNVAVTLHIEVVTAGAARDANGDSLLVELVRAGTPVNGASARVALAAVALPGAYIHTVKFPAGSALVATNETFGIRVTPLAPALQDDAWFIRIGGESPTRAIFERLRVPRLSDLGFVNDADLTYFHLQDETFAPKDPSATIYTASVMHDRVTLGAIRVENGRSAYIVFRGDEDADTASARHGMLDARERRDAAHTFDVNGLRVRVHPGVGVAIKLPTTAISFNVTCTAHCPEGGFSSSVRIEGAAGSGGTSAEDDRRSALIPPPAQYATPTSGATPENDTPLPVWLVLLGAAGVAGLRRRART